VWFVYITGVNENTEAVMNEFRGRAGDDCVPPPCI